MMAIEERGDDSIGILANPPIEHGKFDSLSPTRFDEIFLYESSAPDHYRYKLTVVDRDLLLSSRLAAVTIAFLIPAGRENEYLFSSQRGLHSIAESANCARLVAVAFGRHHSFESQATVQEELAFFVQVVSKQGLFLPRNLYKRHSNNLSIPFMALDGIGSRNVLAEGETKLSGKYLVEQVKTDDTMVRRLYFMDNPFVIQSEVKVMVRGEESAVVDKESLSFAYHKHMAAGICCLSHASTGLVVGLGGGGFLNFLQTALPASVLHVVELDESVVDIAAEYFDCTASERMSVRIGDGLTLEPANELEAPTGLAFESESFDFLAIDVDSKDKTVGMSCPPMSFVSPDYLRRLKALLRLDGLLVLNISARDPAMLDLVQTNLRSVFDQCFISSPLDDSEEKATNVVLFARRTSTHPLPRRVELEESLKTTLQGYVESLASLSGSTERMMKELEECAAAIRNLDDSGDITSSSTSGKGPNNKKKGGNNKKKKGKR